MLGWLRKLRGNTAREPRCLEVREAASAFLAGELPPERQSAIQRHLARCGPCQAFFDSLRSTLGLLRGMPVREAPPSLRDRLAHHLHAQEPPSPGDPPAQAT